MKKFEKILEIHPGELFLHNALMKVLRDLLRRPVFERGDANLIDVLPTTTKQFKNRKHSSTKLTPSEASLKRMRI